MKYHLVVPKKVQRDIARIDAHYRARIFKALLALETNPYLGKKLAGEYALQRSYMVWPYRIVYEIKSHELVVIVIRVGHR